MGNEQQYQIAYGGNVIMDIINKKAYLTSSNRTDVEEVVELLNEYVTKIEEKDEQINQLADELNCLRKINTLTQYQLEVQDRILKEYEEG